MFVGKEFKSVLSAPSGEIRKAPALPALIKLREQLRREPVSVSGAKVLVPLVKGDKVIVFKKRRRKGYQKKNGHRQQFTQIQIENIIG